MAPPETQVLTDAEYQRLLSFRTSLRRFLHWSEQQAEAAGLTAAHHQLLLAIRGHAGASGPTIGEVADSLLLKHHSAVGLVDRAEKAGLVERIPVERARQHLNADPGALLVCGYDTQEKFEQYHLEGAISLDQFESRAPSLPQNREIIFYCA